MASVSDTLKNQIFGNGAAPVEEDKPKIQARTVVDEDGNVHIIIPQRLAMETVRESKPGKTGNVNSLFVTVEVPVFDVVLTNGDAERVKQTKPGFVNLFIRL